jgi:hypothetical protein
MGQSSVMSDNKIHEDHVRPLYIMSLTDMCQVRGLLLGVESADGFNCRVNQHGSSEERCCCACSSVNIKIGRHVVVMEGKMCLVKEYLASDGNAIIIRLINI